MIVVTGSNGFIGSNLIKNLNSLGISDILAVDNHDNEDLKDNIKAVSYTPLTLPTILLV